MPDKAIVKNGPLFLKKQNLNIKETDISSARNRKGVFISKTNNTELPKTEHNMLSHILPSSIILTEGIVISASPIIPIDVYKRQP